MQLPEIKLLLSPRNELSQILQYTNRQRTSLNISNKQLSQNIAIDSYRKTNFQKKLKNNLISFQDDIKKWILDSQYEQAEDFFIQDMNLQKLTDNFISNNKQLLFDCAKEFMQNIKKLIKQYLTTSIELEQKKLKKFISQFSQKILCDIQLENYKRHQTLNRNMQQFYAYFEKIQLLDKTKELEQTIKDKFIKNSLQQLQVITEQLTHQNQQNTIRKQLQLGLQKKSDQKQKKLTKTKYFSTFHENNEIITSICVDDCKQYFYVVSGDRSISKIDCQTKETIIFKRNTHADVITCIISYQDFLITGAQDGYIKFWDQQKLELQEVFTYHKDWVRKLIIQNNKLFSCSDDKKIIVYNLQTKKIDLTIESPDKQPITQFLIMHTNIYFATQSLYKSKYGEIQQTQENIHSMTYTRAMCKIEQKSFATAGENGVVRIWNIERLENTKNIYTNQEIFSLLVFGELLVIGMKKQIQAYNILKAKYKDKFVANSYIYCLLEYLDQILVPEYNNVYCISYQVIFPQQKQQINQ